MEERSRNGKLIVIVLLLVVFCIGLLDRENRKKEREEERQPVIEVLHNVYMTEASGETCRIVLGKEEKEYPLIEKLTEELPACVADVTLKDGVVTKLVLKQQLLEAKVLRIGESFIELEGYGKLLLAEHARVYRLYGDREERTWQDVPIGYTTAAFVSDGERVCAALLLEEVEVSDIRVLIQTASYRGYYHESLECGSETEFYLSDGSERTDWLEAGDKVIVTKALVEQYGGRLYLGTKKNEGRLLLYNVTRSVGVPAYRGTIEVALQGDKLVVVNEVGLEEYLYGVLPSEMPSSYGKEALKAQAVCARSYAYNQLMANRYRGFGAHVDDSVNCQVYQNYGENEAATGAVKETFGKILRKDGVCISAFYFSCSYGHTSDSDDVWGEDAGMMILTGASQTEGEVRTLDLREEEKFLEFLNSDREWYDEDSVWFRWNTVLGAELDEVLFTRLQERQKAVPSCVLKQVGENETTMTFDVGPVDAFGTLKDIRVIERSNSGLVTKLLLVGSKASYLVQKEYNIRYVLAPKNTLYLKDGSTTSNLTMLPSGYFAVEAGENCFFLKGGGYGHGVGMSQYGAKYLAGKGKTCEEILQHFYRDVQVEYLY